MSVHISATPGQIAETVLLPGDPLRAQWIAENYFDSPERYNNVRGMQGFTGTYKGNRVSVQGTGMGMPSISIYAHELFAEYGVQRAIRVGTCGGIGPTKLRDVVIAMTASTDSNINHRNLGFDFAPCADYELLSAAVSAARAAGVDHHVGGIATMDLFYDTNDTAATLEKLGVLALEMETNALYTLAARFGRKALTILTVSDMITTHEQTTSEERETGFRNMIEVALAATFPEK